MAVEDTAHGVGDGFIVVAAVDQDGEQGGDRPRRGAVGPHRARARPLQQLGQFGEDGRRIALCGRWLACGQADLALGHGETGDRVHQAKDLEVLIAHVFADRHGHIGGLAALQGRFVTGGDHDDGAAQPFLAEGFLDELPNLPAPFADQADHDNVTGGLTRQHGKQHRLADAGAGEDAQTLAAAGGGEDVHGADAEVQPLTDPAARMGRGRGCAQGIGSRPDGQGALAVDRLTEGVDDPAQPGGSGADAGGGGDDADVGAGGHALDRAERHQQGLGIAEADHLGGQGGQVPPLDLGPGPDRQARQAAPGLDQQTVHARDLAGHDQRVDRFNGGDESVQAKDPGTAR